MYELFTDIFLFYYICVFFILIIIIICFVSCCTFDVGVYICAFVAVVKVVGLDDAPLDLHEGSCLSIVIVLLIYLDLYTRPRGLFCIHCSSFYCTGYVTRLVISIYYFLHCGVTVSLLLS